MRLSTRKPVCGALSGVINLAINPPEINPVQAYRINLAVIVFKFWWKPEFQWTKLNEQAKRGGANLWHARWLCVQLSAARYGNHARKLPTAKAS